MSIRDRLVQNTRPDEVVTPVDPRRLAGGAWWTLRSRRHWPPELLEGVIEPRRGYRFRPENLAMALMLEAIRPKRVVDLGAGTGSLSLIAAYLVEPERCVAVERQADVAERLRRTFEAHKGGSLTVVEGDLRSQGVRARARDALGGPADLAVANPPYYPRGWGRPSARESTHLSTHAEFGDAGDFLEAALDLLASDGRALMVFDAQRLAHLSLAAGRLGFSIRRLLFIEDQRPSRPPEPFRVWVELGRDDAAGAQVGWIERSASKDA